MQMWCMWSLSSIGLRIKLYLVSVSHVTRTQWNTAAEFRVSISGSAVVVTDKKRR